jgi:hypothetical protein
MSVGYLSKLFETWDAKVERKLDGGSVVIRDMLMGEKLGVCAFGTIIGPITLPFKALDMLNRIDIAMQGHTVKTYGYTRSKTRVVDYLF